MTMNARSYIKMAMALFLGSSVLTLGLAGCGSSASSYCNRACDCVGCSENEHDECIDDYEDAQKAADDEGCGDQFSAASSCLDDEFTCNDGDIDADGCNSENEALFKCLL